MKILLLGGTAEARELAEALAMRSDIDAMLSLAGATSRPARLALPVRCGGFGGIDGLACYLTQHGIDLVIDATHPFAARMSAHAVGACQGLGIPLWRIDRPAWRPQAGDDWHDAVDPDSAAGQLAGFGRRVFLSVGARSLAPFEAVADKLWIVRSIEAPKPPPAFDDWTLIRDRPPFSLAQEIALLREHAIDVLVAKNSGAPATRAKLDAARTLAIPVLMISRPSLPMPDRIFSTPMALWAALDTVHQVSG
ncbi:cobalt-precorrin-6A reductase [Salinisphaera sp. SPP-AMP-43]|uniref:cobalt-precorrin-6A reductase n=1 Tax=Salinisphaera sp. SPP-AMP-43 TaxID=3121288 RepID=UPI003C6E1E40